jgi:hypothetical protein
MKKKLNYLIVAIVLLAAYLLYHSIYNSKQQFYGNNEEMIIETIHSINGYEKQVISVLNISDFDDIRIVGILADNQPGYIKFRRNESGDYQWNEIQVSRDGSTFGFYLPNIDRGQNQKILIVTNQKNDIAKFSVEVNQQLIEQAISPMYSNVIWIDLPKSDSGEYRFENYQYYDEQDQLINM